MKKQIMRLMFLWMLLFLIPCQSYAKITLNKSSKTLVVNQKYSLKVKGSKKRARWSSSDKKIASVSFFGKVKAKAPGVATITAKIGSKKLKCKITVIKPDVSSSLPVYRKETCSIPIKNKNKFSSITYKSTNSKIATVSSSGKVHGTAVGTCNIKITFNKCYTKKITVTVSKESYSSTISMMKGGTRELKPNTYKTISKGTFSVSHPSRGYVKNGIYYSTAFGVNTVTYKNGVFTHTFTVKNYCWEAHRGYCLFAPEETMEAITDAKRYGASAVEIDVRATKDGEFVLMHDSTLTRTTNRTGTVKYLTVEELTSEPIVVGNNKLYYVITLEDALIAAKNLGLTVAIEMKTLPTNSSTTTEDSPNYYAYSKEYLVHKLCDLIKQYGNSRTSVILTSLTNIQDFVKYSDGSITGRVINDKYNGDSAIKNLTDQYSFLMSSTQFANKYYNGLMMTLDYPIR
ncbi:MAG: glycerophosphodiester phosphodiesterase family protein [Eubacteriales bacterium]|nr:glycerophosphodiester phosphodiesterase family protein [Eubacteriales bacterium]